MGMPSAPRLTEADKQTLQETVYIGVYRASSSALRGWAQLQIAAWIDIDQEGGGAVEPRDLGDWGIRVGKRIRMRGEEAYLPNAEDMSLMLEQLGDHGIAFMPAYSANELWARVQKKWAMLRPE